VPFPGNRRRYLCYLKFEQATKFSSCQGSSLRFCGSFSKSCCTSTVLGPRTNRTAKLEHIESAAGGSLAQAVIADATAELSPDLDVVGHP
jgi:hypothetical protein